MHRRFVHRLGDSTSWTAIASPPTSPVHTLTPARIQAIVIATALMLGVARIRHGNIVLVQ